MVPLITAWAGHTDASRAFVEDLRAALDAAGIKHEAFADDMGLRLPQFSRQLAGVEPMNAFRVKTALMKHPRAALALVTLEGRRLGAEVISSEQVALLRAALALGKKKMARILPALVHERKAS